MDYALGLDLGGGPVTVAVSGSEGEQGPDIRVLEGPRPAETVDDLLDRLGAPPRPGHAPAEADVADLVTATVELAAAMVEAAPSALAIAHPSTWGPYRVGLLRAAVAHQAVAVRLVPTAVAAMTHAGARGDTRPGDVVAVLDVRDDHVEVAVVTTGRGDAAPTVMGVPRAVADLGGLDVADAVLAHVRAVLPDATAAVPHADRILLRTACAQAGAVLATAPATTVTWESGGVRHEVRIVASELDERLRPRAARAVSAAADAVAANAPGGVDRVLLLGPLAATPLLAEIVAERFEAPLTVLGGDTHAVARGAAHLASVLGTQAPTPPEGVTHGTSAPRGRRAHVRHSSNRPARMATLLGSGAVALALAALAASGAALASPGDDPLDRPAGVTTTERAGGLRADGALGTGTGTGAAAATGTGSSTVLGPPAASATPPPWMAPGTLPAPDVPDRVGSSDPGQQAAGAQQASAG